MYRIDDKDAAIKNVQRLLGVNETGFYDTFTENAVRNIQSEHSYDKSGKVDYKTFELIADEYKERKTSSSEANYLFAPSFPYVLYDMDENVRLIHSALKSVLKDYVYEEELPEGAFLGASTINAANFLRNIFGMALSDEIDEKFLNRLLLEKKAIEIKQKYR